MIFTKVFGSIGIFYFFMGIINYKSNFSDKLYKILWGKLPPPAIVYTKIGMLSIMCGIFFDFCLWLVF
jgi:hypothetical protein